MDCLRKFFSIFFLVAFAFTQSACNSSSEKEEITKPNPYDEYNRSTKNAVARLSKEKMNLRDSIIETLDKSFVYINLVKAQSLDTKYLPLLTAIGMLLTTNDGNTMGVSKEIAKFVLDENSTKFMSYIVRLETTGGLTPDIVNVFYRFKSEFNYYGTCTFDSDYQNLI
jgi:hypothetical protein